MHEHNYIYIYIYINVNIYIYIYIHILSLYALLYLYTELRTRCFSVDLRGRVAEDSPYGTFTHARILVALSDHGLIWHHATHALFLTEHSRVWCDWCRSLSWFRITIIRDRFWSKPFVCANLYKGFGAIYFGIVEVVGLAAVEQAFCSSIVSYFPSMCFRSAERGIACNNSSLGLVMKNIFVDGADICLAWANRESTMHMISLESMQGASPSM